jgi:hypothetical protein
MIAPPLIWRRDIWFQNQSLFYEEQKSKRGGFVKSDEHPLQVRWHKTRNLGKKMCMSFKPLIDDAINGSSFSYLLSTLENILKYNSGYFLNYFLFMNILKYYFLFFKNLFVTSTY